MARLHAEKSRYHELRSTYCNRDDVEERLVMLPPVEFVKCFLGQQMTPGNMGCCHECFRLIRKSAMPENKFFIIKVSSPSGSRRKKMYWSREQGNNGGWVTGENLATAYTYMEGSRMMRQLSSTGRSRITLEKADVSEA